MKILDICIAFLFLSTASGAVIDLKASSASAKAILQSTSFEFVIVGGGTAGLTLARRLSEDPTKKILVLEAGRSGVGDPLVTTPGNSFKFLGTDIDWGYLTTPQKHASNRVINLSSGKVLGGDSSVNGLVWIRGPKPEYDAIESLGNPGWNWDVFYAAMKKAESLNVPSPELTQEFGFQVHPQSLGSNGPIDVSFPDFLPIGHQKMIEASVELGHHFNKDAYSGNNTGVFYSLSSETNRGVRDSAETGYLDPITKRKNLLVFSNALVTKLNVTNVGRNQAATSGVQVRFPDGSIQFARVKSSDGEVILSAGAIRTPQLLELSGIGNPSVLALHGIDVKVDLRGVGENFEDHILDILVYKLKEPFVSLDALKYNATLNAEQQELYKSGKGWFTFAQGVMNMEPAHVILTPAELEEARRLLQMKPPTISEELFNVIKDQIFNGVPMVEYLIFNSFPDGFVSEDLKEPNRSYFSLAPTYLHPLSRGSVHINTTSIDDHPIIDLNFLESEFDRWFLAKALAYGRKFFETGAMREIFEPQEVFPSPNVTTQAQWEEYVKNGVNGGYHLAGTASLLPRSKNGVVDPNLKVYGTTNIRVADMSIMPLLLSAHTQPAAYAIGEIAANIIKNGRP